jgi:hypothetical protein
MCGGIPWISLKALKNNASFDGGDSLGLANRGLTMCFAAKPLNSKRPAGQKTSGPLFRSGTVELGERRNGLGQTRKLTRCCVLVHDAACHAACQFWLRCCERGRGFSLITSGECELNLLDESADTAHAIAVDFRATVVATDALFCLRRIRHAKSLNAKMKSGAGKARTGLGASLAKESGEVNLHR